MTQKEIKIEGMTCHHCAMAVQRELAKLPRLTVNDVKIGSAVVSYDEGTVTMEQIRGAVEKAGYRTAGQLSA